MNILLDTHIALWVLADSPRLVRNIRSLLETDDTTVFVSVATLWEIAIKHAAERGDMPISGEDARKYCLQSGFYLLPITAQHAVVAGALPPYHRDPFDRMLVAQAITEPLRLVSHDKQVLRYSDTFIAA
ncbi:twitching motility protein PilT [Betaproteobacteria bacterium]|nr:twitching motility protein PilT [Betaproteobacteria bacterium]